MRAKPTLNVNCLGMSFSTVLPASLFTGFFLAVFTGRKTARGKLPSRGHLPHHRTNCRLDYGDDDGDEPENEHETNRGGTAFINF